MSKYRRRQKKIAKKGTFDNLYGFYVLQEWPVSSLSFAEVCNQDWSHRRSLTMEDFERARKLIMGEPI